MKIIGGPKDYFDYLTGLYGVDDKIVLDRRDHKQPDLTGLDNHVSSIFFCGNRIDFVKDGDKFLYMNELVSKYGKNEIYSFGKNRHPSVYVAYRESAYINWVPDKNQMNKLHDCPILLRVYGNHFYKYPKLIDLQFKKVMSPQEAYLQLCEWLAPKDKDSNPLSDKDKIITNGFDPITSFRNTK